MPDPTPTPAVLPDARAREVLQSLTPYRLQFEDDACADRRADNIPVAVAVAAMLAYAAQPAVTAEAIEAAARAMCDRVNGQGDYDENVGQRRAGWVAQAQTGIAEYLATATPPASDAAVPATKPDWLHIAKTAGKYGIRYSTNSRLIAFLSEIAAAPKVASDTGLRELLQDARNQLEYLDGRWPTGTTPATIARIDAALATDATDGATGGGKGA